jgi:hypothetical protein
MAPHSHHVGMKTDRQPREERNIDLGPWAIKKAAEADCETRDQSMSSPKASARALFNAFCRWRAVAFTNLRNPTTQDQCRCLRGLGHPIDLRHLKQQPAVGKPVSCPRSLGARLHDVPGRHHATSRSVTSAVSSNAARTTAARNSPGVNPASAARSSSLTHCRCHGVSFCQVSTTVAMRGSNRIPCAATSMNRSLPPRMEPTANVQRPGSGLRIDGIRPSGVIRIGPLAPHPTWLNGIEGFSSQPSHLTVWQSPRISRVLRGRGS